VLALFAPEFLDEVLNLNVISPRRSLELTSLLLGLLLFHRPSGFFDAHKVLSLNNSVYIILLIIKFALIDPNNYLISSTV